jgi:hypothetical protein
LASFDLSYEYKDRAQIEKEIPVEYERIKNFPSFEKGKRENKEVF